MTTQRLSEQFGKAQSNLDLGGRSGVPTERWARTSYDGHEPWSTSRGPNPGRAPALRRTGLGDGDEIDASSCADPTPSPTRARAYPVHGGWP